MALAFLLLCVEGLQYLVQVPHALIIAIPIPVSLYPKKEQIESRHRVNSSQHLKIPHGLATVMALVAQVDDFPVQAVHILAAPLDVLDELGVGVVDYCVLCQRQ